MQDATDLNFEENFGFAGNLHLLIVKQKAPERLISRAALKSLPDLAKDLEVHIPAALWRRV
jgi:hypothetical protein